MKYLPIFDKTIHAWEKKHLNKNEPGSKLKNFVSGLIVGVVTWWFATCN